MLYTYNECFLELKNIHPDTSNYPNDYQEKLTNVVFPVLTITKLSGRAISRYWANFLVITIPNIIGW